jgi:hypothetical protein
VVNQKARELAQFDRFSRSARVGPFGSLRQPNQPEPDIVLDSPTGCIGVELTDLHPSGEAKRRDETEQGSLVERAKAAYDQAGHPPVHVWFDWTSGKPYDWKRSRPWSAEALSNLIARHYPASDGLHEISDGSSALVGDLPLADINLARASSREGSEWRDGRFHEVEPYGVDEVQARITQEDPKVARYVASYASAWLILVAGAAGPSTWGVPDAGIAKATYRTRFDRVFLFEYERSRCIELNLRLVECAS